MMQRRKFNDLMVAAGLGSLVHPLYSDTKMEKVKNWHHWFRYITFHRIHKNYQPTLGWT